ncbi:MAG: hypothetical protein K1X89_11495 [Myxococcaceae bacterium]|nr:hypothetical protein [Myxococcaceae bacterium]
MRSSLFLTLALTACGLEVTDEASAPVATAQDALNPGASVAAMHASAAKVAGRWARRFPLATTRSIFVAVDVSGASPGGHVVELTFVQPGGLPWQVQTVSFQATGSGGKHAAPERVWVELPVVGTWIEQYALTGRWTVEAAVDHGRSSSLTFILE